MNLYEVTNGYNGNSYIRCYAWAKDENQALELARKSFKKEAEVEPTLQFPSLFRFSPPYWKRLRIRLLFSQENSPFVSEPCDGGFGLQSIERWMVKLSE